MCTCECPKLPKQGAGAKPQRAARETSEGKASHHIQNPSYLLGLVLVIDFLNPHKPDMNCNSYMPKCWFGQPISDIIFLKVTLHALTSLILLGAA